MICFLCAWQARSLGLQIYFANDSLSANYCFVLFCFLVLHLDLFSDVECNILHNHNAFIR